LNQAFLRDLTDHDSKKSVSRSHRRKILRAIAELDEAGPRPALLLGPRRERHLTVMFADLVGSTALSTSLDPEDLQEIMGAYHRCCAEQSRNLAGSLPDTWVTACSLISAIRGR